MKIRKDGGYTYMVGTRSMLAETSTTRFVESKTKWLCTHSKLVHNIIELSHSLPYSLGCI